MKAVIEMVHQSVGKEDLEGVVYIILNTDDS